MFWWNGLFTGFTDTVLLHYLSLFALAYGASNSEIGLLAAAAGLGAAMSFLPGAWLSGRWCQRKPFILLTRGILGHLLLLAFAVLPLAVDAPLVVRLIIVAAVVRSFAANLPEGAWTSLASDLVPAEFRGRYFAARNFILGVGGLVGVGLVAGLLAGLGADRGWPAVWLVVLALGAAATWFYTRIPERDLPSARTDRAPAEKFDRAMLRDTNFLTYGGTVLLWTLSLYTAAPFFNVHLVKNLGASPVWVGGLLAVTAAFGLLGQLVFGRIVDARGPWKVTAVSGATVSFLPLAWFFVGAPYQVIFINAVAGVAWAAYLLSGFNFLLAISPRGQQRYYAAVYQTIVYLSIFAGPLIGGVVAEAYGIKSLFIISGLGRMAAIALFVAFVRETRFEVPAARTRRARQPALAAR